MLRGEVASRDRRVTVEGAARSDILSTLRAEAYICTSGCLESETAKCGADAVITGASYEN